MGCIWKGFFGYDLLISFWRVYFGLYLVKWKYWFVIVRGGDFRDLDIYEVRKDS